MVNWFNSLDPAIRPALLTATATFFAALVATAGVWAGFWLNLRKHRDDRTLALKKDVFLSLADVQAELIASIRSLLARKQPANAANPAYIKFAGCVGKLHCISRPETLKQVFKLQGGLMAAYQKAMEFKAELVKLENVLSTRERALEKCQDLLERISKNPVASEENFQTVQRMLENTQTSVEEATLAAAASTAQLGTTLQQFLFRVVVPEAITMTTCIHKELGSKVKEKWYRDEMDNLLRAIPRTPNGSVSASPEPTE
jgi:hypothetical protein